MELKNKNFHDDWLAASRHNMEKKGALPRSRGRDRDGAISSLYQVKCQAHGVLIKGETAEKLRSGEWTLLTPEVEQAVSAVLQDADQRQADAVLEGFKLVRDGYANKFYAPEPLVTT